MHDPSFQPHAYPPEPYRPPRPWVTWIIIGTTVAVFLLQLLYVHLTGQDVVGNTLAFNGQALSEGRVWTLITYAWVHAVIIFGDPGLFWLHITANMIPLFCLGPALEEFLGPWRFLGLYLGGAIVAALTWYFFAAGPGSNEPIAGASGAVFAVIAAIGTVAPRARVTVFLFYILPLRMNLRTVAVVACVIEAIQMIFGWMPEIAHSAHLGGAAFGFFYVFVIRLLSRRDIFPN
ncbi:MAG TPA: rhomboid family intramembrane serine protease [Candidatus Methylacidiphilales bacterium]|nr:rhomboid family intramembrane serine protease [Candidatus Methylacidiphilales bacterium]